MALAWHTDRRTGGIHRFPGQPLRANRDGHRQPFSPWAWTQLDTPMLYAMPGITSTGMGDAGPAGQGITITPGEVGQFYQALSPGDARTQLATVTAKIANLQAEKAKYPFLNVFGVLDNQIASLQAQLGALQQNAALQSAGDTATADWRKIGQTLGLVGIAFGIVATVALGAGAVLTARRIS